MVGKQSYYDTNYDLEFGKVSLSRKVKWLVDMYRKNENNMRYIIISFVIVTVALIIKFAFYNLDSVVKNTGGVITLDEDVYKPFKMSTEIIPNVDGRASIRFPVKESQVNWRIQTLNIVQARAQAVSFLENSGFLCVHLRHFGVPYDIMVFQNATMVNPSVIAESDEQILRNELTLSGKTIRKKRPTWIKIAYKDESLTDNVVTLWGWYATCFAHYEF